MSRDEDDLIHTLDQVLGTLSPEVAEMFGCLSGAHEWRIFATNPDWTMRMCATCQKVQKLTPS